MRIGPMAHGDLAGVLDVQAACYPPAMQEPARVVRARLAASPGTVLVARDDDGVCAYLFAYPSRLGKVTPLNGPFTVPAEPDTLYLHDLAVAPRAAGQGVARRLVARLHDDAARRGLRHAALVSVQDSLAFWESLGYVPAAGDDAALATYPGAAHYMAKRL
jgi:GNAT superfamily N-acetyltransferase